MITYNDLYYVKDGQPWFPISGEYQYSRADVRYWKEGIAKMKATGIDVVASYAFWLHHEEIKGHFDFRGNRNLRRFLREIKDAGMLMCLRIGPWVHAEARNGGFPDWIYQENCKTRSNDPVYMAYVERYFKELFKQCDGYMYSQGGPIYAIQVENEYSQWGVQGEDVGDVHINALIKMLKDIGFDVPVYYATGWGQAALGDAIAVWGAYAEQPWARDEGELPPLPTFLFSPNPNDENIGNETGKKQMDADVGKLKYPYSTVELSGGGQVTDHRRPVLRGTEHGAVTMCRVGSEASTIGYYVYHGGMNPVGALTTMQEYYREGPLVPGFCSDLLEINYDFQAPISQYSKVQEKAGEFKLCNYFARDFGVEQMRVTFFDDNVTDPTDLESLRYTVRSKGNQGFLFINNYVRHYDLPCRDLKNFQVELESEIITIPTIHLENKEYCAYPLNMPMGNAILKYATATPFCTLNGTDYVFWSKDGKMDYQLQGEFQGKIIVLDKKQALKAYKLCYQGKERLFIANGELYQTDEGLHFNTFEKPEIKIYPALEESVEGLHEIGKEGDFGIYTAPFERQEWTAKVLGVKTCEKYVDFEIGIEYSKGKKENGFLYIDFDGDTLELLIDGEKVNDHYYIGVDFEVGLRYYDFPNTVCARIYPLDENKKVYLEKRPTFKDGKAVAINKVYAKKETRYLF